MSKIKISEYAYVLITQKTNIETAIGLLESMPYFDKTPEGLGLVLNRLDKIKSKIRKDIEII